MSAIGNIVYPVNKTYFELHKGAGPSSERRTVTSLASKIGQKLIDLSKRIEKTRPDLAQKLFNGGKRLRWLTRPLGKVGLGYAASVVTVFEVTYDMGVAIYCGIECSSECDCD